jgi:diadenosine tetraphosphate (Ap4A) HIT family hydrolase
MLPNTSCPFCIKDQDQFLHNEFAYVRCDKNPVTPGHVLIIPFRHIENYFDTTVEERAALNRLLDETKAFLDGCHAPNGYNIGVNIGEVAGQTVPHVHLHLIPRYTGDTEKPQGGVRGVIPARQAY